MRSGPVSLSTFRSPAAPPKLRQGPNSGRPLGRSPRTPVPARQIRSGGRRPDSCSAPPALGKLHSPRIATCGRRANTNLSPHPGHTAAPKAASGSTKVPGAGERRASDRRAVRRDFASGALPPRIVTPTRASVSRSRRGTPSRPRRFRLDLARRRCEGAPLRIGGGERRLCRSRRSTTNATAGRRYIPRFGGAAPAAAQDQVYCEQVPAAQQTDQIPVTRCG